MISEKPVEVTLDRNCDWCEVANLPCSCEQHCRVHKGCIMSSCTVKAAASVDDARRAARDEVLAWALDFVRAQQTIEEVVLGIRAYIEGSGSLRSLPMMKMDLYLALERQMLAFDRAVPDNSFADCIRDAMDSIWALLSDQDRAFLDSRKSSTP